MKHFPLSPDLLSVLLEAVPSFLFMTQSSDMSRHATHRTLFVTTIIRCMCAFAAEIIVLFCFALWLALPPHCCEAAALTTGIEPMTSMGSIPGQEGRLIILTLFLRFLSSVCINIVIQSSKIKL